MSRPSDYKLILETPTLSGKVVVVENQFFKDRLAENAKQLSRIIQKHKSKKKGG